MDFSTVESKTCMQEVILNQRQLEGQLIPFNFVKFQNVNHLSLFIASNQGTLMTEFFWFNNNNQEIQKLQY